MNMTETALPEGFLWSEDMQILANLGFNACRFSSW